MSISSHTIPTTTPLGADNIFPVSVLDQEESAEIDLMYAETNVGHNADGESPTLMFTHKLSRLLFEIEDTNGKSLDGITARITGLHTEGEFDLSTGALTLEDGSDATPIAIRTVSVTGSTAVLEAIVLPDATATFDIEFTVPGSEPMTRSGVAANFAEGTTYTWEVNMTDEDLGDVGSMILMGAANISDWIEGTRDNFDLSREPGEVTPPPAGDWTAVFSDDFSILSEGDNTTSTGANSGWAGDVNWIVESAYSAGGMVKLGTGTKVGSITSKSLDFAGATTVKVTVSVKGWSSVEGTLNVTVGSETQNIAYTETQSAATPGTYSIEFTAPSGTGTVRLATSAKRAYIDEVVIEKK